MDVIVINRDDGTVCVIRPTEAFYNSNDRDKFSDLIHDIKRQNYTYR